METNSHILTINRNLGAALSIVHGMTDSTEKQTLIYILDNICDQLFSVNSDLEAANQRNAELTKQIYEPLIEAQVNRRPKEHSYNAVREYIEKRKNYDPVFKQYCRTHNRKQLCERLSEEFGWIVDEKSLGRNLLRH